MKRKNTLIGLLMAVLIIASSQVSFGSTNAIAYNVIVPAFGGINTPVLTKNSTVNTAYNKNVSINSGDTLYSVIKLNSTQADITDSDWFTNAGWSRMTYSNPSWYVGSQTTMHIWSGPTTLNELYCSGSWTPDNN